MITTRSSTQHGSPRGHQIAAALLVSTLAGTALVACDADTKGSQPAKVSGRSVGETVGEAKITSGALS